jgi:hypothetical protein
MDHYRIDHHLDCGVIHAVGKPLISSHPDTESTTTVAAFAPA